MQADTTDMDFGYAETDSFQQNEVVVPNVLIQENPGKNHKFPYSLNLERNLSPDWILLISLIVLVIFAWINVIYSRFIRTILVSAFNFQLSLRFYGEPNQVQKRISRLFDLIYFITTGLYLYMVYNYFNLNWVDIQGFKLFLVFTGILISFSLLRVMLYEIAGWLFDQLKVFNEAIFHNFLYNKFTGIVMVPFILAIAYTNNIFLDIIVYTSLTVFISINILRLARGILFSVKKVFSIFYFILYLCTLEILPVLVIVKVIFLLAKVS